MAFVNTQVESQIFEIVESQREFVAGRGAVAIQDALNRDDMPEDVREYAAARWLITAEILQVMKLRGDVRGLKTMWFHDGEWIEAGE